jgi:hypothetical protein
MSEDQERLLRTLMGELALAENLRKQNRLLRSLVGDLTTILQQLIESLPPDFQQLENVRRSIVLTGKIQGLLAAALTDEFFDDARKATKGD